MKSHHEQDILAERNVAIASTHSTEGLPDTLKAPALVPTDSTKDLSAGLLERVSVQPASLSLFYLCWQKMLDMLFGLTGLLLLLILLPFLALLIYLDSPGPIFYHQERVGYRGRKFLMHKLRSMHHDTGRSSQLLWRTAGNQRVTRIGRFMRATHMDELPQVINILRGEMTLIGPRPQRPEYVAELEESDPRYRSRLSVKPGLTGWAQVNYGYGNSHWDDLTKLQYDLHYIAHHSTRLDVLIIMRTVIEVIRRSGDK